MRWRGATPRRAWPRCASAAAWASPCAWSAAERKTSERNPAAAFAAAFFLGGILAGAVAAQQSILHLRNIKETERDPVLKDRAVGGSFDRLLRVVKHGSRRQAENSRRNRWHGLQWSPEVRAASAQPSPRH